MSYAKKNLFEKNEMELADIAKALSHPARIKILKILSAKQICICGEIVNELPLAQATVSQHLKELKRIGIIEGEIEGPSVCYCLNVKKLKITLSHFDRLLSILTNHKQN